MPWYFFAAATPILYTVTNYIDKFLIENKIKDPIAMTAFTSLISGALGLIGLTFLGFPKVDLISTCLILLAGIFITFYLLPYFEALKSDDTSRVVPLFQFIPFFTLVLSAIFLKETLATKQIFGLILVVISGVLLSAEKIESKIFKPRKALWLMLFSGLMYGCVGLLFRFVSKDMTFWTTVAYEYTGTGIAGILLFLSPKIRSGLASQLPQLRSSAPTITINNAIAIIAQLSEVYAVTLVAVPLVNIVGGIQPLVVVIFGYFLTIYFPHLIKEDIRKSVILHKLVSVVIIFAGLYLVYF